MIRKNERGAGNWKAVLTLVLFIAFIYAMVRIAPHFVNHYELKDFCETEARGYSYNQRTETEIHDNIMKKIRDLDIPLKDVKITKSGRRVKINATYTVSVEFPFYTFTKEFVIDVDNQGV